jgi:GNAT superfamily N-acetyltransferase
VIQLTPPEPGGTELWGLILHLPGVDITVAEDQLTSLPAALAEGAEAEFMFVYETGAPAGAREQLGAAATRLGGGVVLSMRDDVTRYWSKALGFGFTEPVTRELLAEVFAFYRANGDSGAVLQLAPPVLPPDWDELCAEFGLEAGNRIQKLACPIDAFQPGRTDLRIDRVDADSVAEWAALVLEIFGMPAAGLAEMLIAGLENPAFTPVAAWDGDEMVAAANLCVHGPIGSLNTGATKPSHRGRGAQSGLLAARAELARQAGCRWLVGETAETGTSLNNMRRSGLKILYTRQNWKWSAGQQSGAE